jgi:hypothetical protein
VERSSVREEFDARLKDRSVVEVEVAEKVLDRLSNWGKIWLWLLGINLAILGASLTVLGIRSYDKLLNDAQIAAAARMTAKIDQVSQDFEKKASDKIGQVSQEFEKKADKKIEKASQDFEKNANRQSEEQLHKAVRDAVVGIQSQAKAEFASAEAQLASTKAQLEAQIASSRSELDKRIQGVEALVGTACADGIRDVRDCHSNYPTGCSAAARYDAYLNYLKNLPPRPPPEANFLDQQAFEKLNALTPIALGRGNNHSDFKDELTKLGEGSQYGVVGYLYYYQSAGAESSNCELTGVDNVDFQIGVGFAPAPEGASRNELQQKSIVVEMTPHYRAQFHPNDWTLTSLGTALGHKVRIVGQLLADSEHNKPSDNCALADKTTHCWRYSIWELHPVTSLEYCADDSCSETSGNWIPLGSTVRGSVRLQESTQSHDALLVPQSLDRIKPRSLDGRQHAAHDADEAENCGRPDEN